MTISQWFDESFIASADDGYLLARKKKVECHERPRDRLLVDGN